MLSPYQIFVLIFSILNLFVGALSIIIILRNQLSKESVLFCLFLGGLTIHNSSFIILQIESIKIFYYPIAVIVISITVSGLFLFSSSMRNRGKISNNTLIVTSFMVIPPVLCVLLTPYEFLQTSYGYELIVDPFFLALYTIMALSYGSYAIYNFIFFSKNSPYPDVKAKIKIIVIALILAIITSCVFFIILPVFYQIQELKPIGFFALTIAICMLAFAFSKNK